MASEFPTRDALLLLWEEARSYLRLEELDDPCVTEDGAALHPLKKALERCAREAERGALDAAACPHSEIQSRLRVDELGRVLAPKRAGIRECLLCGSYSLLITDVSEPEKYFTWTPWVHDQDDPSQWTQAEDAA